MECFACKSRIKIAMALIFEECPAGSKTAVAFTRPFCAVCGMNVIHQAAFEQTKNDGLLTVLNVPGATIAIPTRGLKS